MDCFRLLAAGHVLHQEDFDLEGGSDGLHYDEDIKLQVLDHLNL